jgi:hypothetical protein
MLAAAPGAAQDVQPAIIKVSATPLALDKLDAGHVRVGKLVYRGGLVLSADNAAFGGLSGLAISADGAKMLAVGDRGIWFSATLEYQDGRLSGLGDSYLASVLKWNGKELDFGENDAEALAFPPGGGALVAFESWHRIWRYPYRPAAPFGLLFETTPQPYSLLPGLKDAPSNGGIEALAALADGRVLAISEEMKTGEGVLAGWIIKDDRAQALGYHYDDGFRPTGMARGPDGDLFIVERSFSLMSGVAVRIMRLEAAAVIPGAVLRPVEIARLADPLSVDNMEGIALRRSAQGRTLVYLVSDDNFNPLQRTLLMMFELAE